MAASKTKNSHEYHRLHNKSVKFVKSVVALPIHQRFLCSENNVSGPRSLAFWIFDLRPATWDLRRMMFSCVTGYAGVVKARAHERLAGNPEQLEQLLHGIAHREGCHRKDNHNAPAAFAPEILSPYQTLR